MGVICQAEGITFRYFEQARRNILEDCSCTFQEGEVTVILGESGCGKSTLLAVLAGLYPENGGYLASGRVNVSGKEISSLPTGERSCLIAEMFQNPDLQFCMDNLRDELRFCLENQCVPREEMDARIERHARRYGLSDLLDQPFRQLSGGEKQKAALACLLLIDPKVLLLDEPFANLDPDSRRMFRDLLAQKVKEKKTAVIAVDHHASNWDGLADRYLVMSNKGKDMTETAAVQEEQWDAAASYHLADGTYADVVDEEETYVDEVGAAEVDKAIEATNTETPLLVLQDVSIRHQKRGGILLNDISLSADRGEMIACLGPSGGGKTSLFLTLLQQKPYTGSIRLEGKELSKIRRKDLFSKIGIVFQNPGNQFVASTVRGEVEHTLRISQGSVDKKAADDWLEQFRLKPYAAYSPYMLSQGQQRRLGVLTMLAGNQKLLLLDEPTYGQDRKNTQALMAQMKHRTENGLTVIFSTHDAQMAYAYADKIWRIEGGTVYEEDQPVS